MATQNHSDGLTKAAAVLEATQEIAPATAEDGLAAAVEHVREAQKRAPGQEIDQLPDDVDRPSIAPM